MKRIVDNAVPAATGTILANNFVLEPIAQQHLASWVSLTLILPLPRKRPEDFLPGIIFGRPLDLPKQFAALSAITYILRLVVSSI